MDCLKISNLFFSAWTTSKGNLYRIVGNMEGPLADKNVSRLFEFVHIGNISLPPLNFKDQEDVLEETHNRVHRWIGGEMRMVETAAQDPVFYIFHSFIDLIWTDFRQHQRANGIDPETDWDVLYGQSRHHKYSPMGLGNMMASDGSNEMFAENIRYTARPSCSRKQTDCKSPLLYCNVVAEKCVPWTIDEYDQIKLMAKAKFIPFAIEAKSTIKDKISAGFEELNRPVTKPETTTKMSKAVTDDGHNHHHDHDHSHGTGMYDDHLDVSPVNVHETHDHSGHQHEQEKVVKSVLEILLEYTLLLVVGLLLMIRISMCVGFKCRSERANRMNGTCRKYNMDGIVNQNYQNEGNKVDDSEAPEIRSDNIYTVTVTCQENSTLAASTYVRFSRYIIGKHDKTELNDKSAGKNRNNQQCVELLCVKNENNKGRESEENYDVVDPKYMKKAEFEQVEHLKIDDNSRDIVKHQLNENNERQDVPAANGHVESVGEATARPTDDYMDMTYATKVYGSLTPNHSSDVFEKEAASSELRDDDDDDDDDGLNSVENENFELPIAATEDSFAFLDDYDNVYFKETIPAAAGSSEQNSDREKEKEGQSLGDNITSSYISSGHM